MIKTTEQMGIFKQRIASLMGLMDELVLVGGRRRLVQIMNEAGYQTESAEILSVQGVKLQTIADGTPQVVVTFTYDNTDMDEDQVGTFFIETSSYCGKFVGDY